LERLSVPRYSTIVAPFIDFYVGGVFHSPHIPRSSFNTFTPHLVASSLVIQEILPFRKISLASLLLSCERMMVSI
jgi:hypothetical protein